MTPDFSRVLITGGRDYRDALIMMEELKALKYCASLQSVLPTIVHGDASGADQFADCIAQLLGMEPERHPADWKRWGKRAGALRNQEMLDAGIGYAIVFPGGSGTADMTRRLNATSTPYRKVGINAKS